MSTDRCTDKDGVVHTYMEYCSAVKRMNESHLQQHRWT